MEHHATLSVFLVLIVAGCGRAPNGGTKPASGEGIAKVPVGDEEIVEVPSTVNIERVKNVGLPEIGSENVSHLLVLPPNLLRQLELPEQRNYRPDDAIEWVVDIEFEGNLTLEASAISNAFDTAWLKANGQPTIYGWSPEIDRWAYVVASDAPKTFTKLAFGWPLFKSYDEEFRIASTDLEGYFVETKSRANRLGSPSLRTNRSPTEAVERSALIRRVVAECDRDVVIVVKAPDGMSFNGKHVWDVMMCLGLRWGDFDLFHWHNDTDFGDDMFFSVETTSPPGYFLPEDIAEGRTQIADLVFSYSIPRSVEPRKVLESMLRAASYTKDRLGGKLEDRDGLPLNESVLKSEVDAIVEKMKEAGFKPGDDATLYVF